VAYFGDAKARVDVDGNSTKSSAGEDCGKVIRAIWQPQRDPITRTDPRVAQTCRHAQHAVFERAPVERAGGVRHHRSFRPTP
jgi:hypothetical protein